jgi:DNA-binding NarL/FixJ family response regulator
MAKARTSEAPSNHHNVMLHMAADAAQSLITLHPVEHASSVEPTIPISIVSNSLILREGLVLLLTPHINLHLVNSYPAESGPPISVLDNPPRHVVLLDSNIGCEVGVAWTEYWRSQPVPAQVLMIELLNDLEVIFACMEAGAGGYTLQGASMSEVAEAIQVVNKGLAWCPPEIALKLFEHVVMLRTTQHEPDAQHGVLTARELEVLEYVAEGFSNQEISDTLAIEICTVKHHVHNILGKLQVRCRRDAAQYAIKHRLSSISRKTPLLRQ